MSEKSAIDKLQYGNRFGGDVARAAKASLSVASSASDAEVASAKYARWFRGDDGQTEPLATAIHRFHTILPTMAAAEIAQLTKENLSILGDDASNLFTSKLPPQHRLRKTSRSAVLPGVPYLGTCKFGEVVASKSADYFSVTQIFIANFDGELNTSEGAAFYKPASRDFDQMFFGVHMLVDRFGNALGFDRKRGEDGIAFKTKDIAKALYSIASLSTGLSIEALQARASAAAAKTK